jgi:hypothetical protein
MLINNTLKETLKETFSYKQYAGGDIEGDIDEGDNEGDIFV